jgi:1-acyl-sn-glycerol-3-phosphate acyltransferase
VRQRPDPLPWYLYWRTNLFHMPLMTVVTAVCALTALFVSLFEKRGRLQHRIAQLWARLMIFFGATKVTVKGRENLLKCPAAVYASNHTSYMDTPVIFASLPFQFRILARKALWPIAFIGWYLNRSGQLPIDTGNPHATLASLGAAVKTLRAGMPLFVFPEGGRTANGQLKPFLSGAAYLAIRAQVPLVPMALVGVYDLLPIHTRHLFPRPVTLVVGEPMDTHRMSVRQVDELTARLRDKIQGLVDAEKQPVD